MMWFSVGFDHAFSKVVICAVSEKKLLELLGYNIDNYIFIKRIIVIY